MKLILITVLCLAIVHNTLATCPAFWTEWNSNCYRLFGGPKSWIHSEEHCRSLGGNLVSVNGFEENQFVYQFWRSSTTKPHMGFWLGANDIYREGTFQWTDGSDFSYERWYAAEPNDFGSDEDCVHLWWREPSSGQEMSWNDRSCTESEMAYICKMVAA